MRRLGVFICCVAGLALCGGASPATATDLGTVGSLNYRSENTGSVNALFTGSALVKCRRSAHITGGGFTVSGPNLESYANSSTPYDLVPASIERDSRPDDGWTLDFANLTGGAKSGTAFAVCAEREPAYVRERVRAPAFAAKSAKVKCPRGTHVNAGGAFLRGAIEGGFINSTHPFDGSDPDLAPDDGWRARVYNDQPRTRLTVTAVCGRAFPDYSVGGPLTLPPGSDFNFQRDCLSGAHALGAGVKLTGPAVEARTGTAGPLDLPDDADIAPDDSVLAGVGNAPAGSSKTVTLIAICL